MSDPDSEAAGTFERRATLLSQVMLLDDAFQSPAEWQLEVSRHDNRCFQLRHLRTGHYLSPAGLHPGVEQAGGVTLSERGGCAEHPELTVDAEGAVQPRQWEDGVFGIVDAHEHLFTNMGFGGGGIFHGAPYHRLGVEHALPSCATFRLPGPPLQFESASCPLARPGGLSAGEGVALSL